MQALLLLAHRLRAAIREAIETSRKFETGPNSRAVFFHGDANCAGKLAGAIFAGDLAKYYRTTRADDAGHQPRIEGPALRYNGKRASGTPRQGSAGGNSRRCSRNYAPNLMARGCSLAVGKQAGARRLTAARRLAPISFFINNLAWSVEKKDEGRRLRTRSRIEARFDALNGLINKSTRSEQVDLEKRAWIAIGAKSIVPRCINEGDVFGFEQNAQDEVRFAARSNSTRIPGGRLRSRALLQHEAAGSAIARSQDRRARPDERHLHLIGSLKTAAE